MTHVPAKVAHVPAKVKRVCQPVPNELVKAHVKIRVHLCAICAAGVIFYLIFTFKIDNPLLDSFGPLAPNVFQEIIDEFKRL